ncbi:MAG: hypothetical protein NTZ73_02790 [Candidatus Diapherotrites archaeon]|nr:hypothetical protein [Candidatus Diapherotrites archaeon]
MGVPKIFGKSAGRMTRVKRREIAEKVSQGIALQESRKLLAEKGKYSLNEIRKAFVEKELPVRVRIATKIALDRLGVKWGMGKKGDMGKRQRIYEIMDCSLKREEAREFWGKEAYGDPAQEELARQLLKELGSSSALRKFNKYQGRELRKFLPLTSRYMEVGIKRASIENYIRAMRLLGSKVKK